jgi:hypothetical protein
MTPEVTKTVLNKIILNVWTNIIIWPRDRASISVQQLRIIQYHSFANSNYPNIHMSLAYCHKDTQFHKYLGLLYIH